MMIVTHIAQMVIVTYIACKLFCHCIKSGANCTCKSCNLQYVVSTVSKFSLRFHRSRIRNFIHSAVDDSLRLYEHFSNHSSSFIECLTVSFVERSVDEISLRQSETEWIWRLNTVFPNGLNVNDGFHSQLRHKRA